MSLTLSEKSLKTMGLPQTPLIWDARGENVAFQINFLNQCYLTRSVRILLVSCLLIYFAVQLIVFTGLGIMLMQNKWNGVQAKRRMVEVFDSRISRETLNVQMADLQQKAEDRLAKMKSLTNLQKERFSFADKLAGIANTLPLRTWVSELKMQQQNRSLLISASYLIDANRPYDLPVTDWITALKGDPQFSRNLQDIVMLHSSQSTLEKADLYLFELKCTWKSDL